MITRGALSVKLACARILRITISLPPSPTLTPSDFRTCPTLSINQKFKRIAEAEIERAIGRDKDIKDPNFEPGPDMGRRNGLQPRKYGL